MPRPMRVLLAAHANWIAGLKPVEENAAIAAMLRRLVFHIVINMALVMAVFLGASYPSRDCSNCCPSQSPATVRAVPCCGPPHCSFPCRC